MRIAWILCLLAAIAGAPAAAIADDRPKAPLRILVPLPAGSTSDAVARLIAERLRDDLGRPVLIEDKPGASGRIAVEALLRAPRDGSTVLLAPVAVPVIVPLVFRNPGFDTSKDLAPVAEVSRFEYALAVDAKHLARTVDELAAWAKANPGRATFGTPGAGSIPHFLGTALNRAAGIELVHVPYRGAAQVEAELIGGQITAGIGATADFGAMHRAGRLRILATSGRTRSALLPAVPTFREQGYPALEMAGWQGVFAAAGTPEAAIERLALAIVTVLRVPEVREKMIALGLEPTGTGPAALGAVVRADIARWRVIVRDSGFTAE